MFVVLVAIIWDVVSVVDDGALLTTGEAAVVLGSSRQHIVDLCERGHLSYIKIGAHRRLRRAEVEALVKLRLTRDQERSLWLHRVVAGRVALDPEGTLAKARANFNTLRQAHQGSAAGRWIERWQVVLDGPLDALLDLLSSPSARAIELRQNSPFAGVLSEQERQSALAAFRVHWRRDHVA